ncbi:MAG: sodium:calcium antiporter [Candidatus Omnitrophica bacterium]|nr:sodium:calcium antiporter [Candidatus Omnitrophota bacterium]
MALLTFCLLLLGIVIAAALLSYGAEIFAERWGANFVGSIVLGLITTLPEYFFVIWACIKGQYQMAVGSAVGACSLLVTLGYGMVILVATSPISRKPVKEIELSKTTQIDALYLLVTAVVAFFLAWEKGGFDLKDAFILIGLFVAYMVHLSHTAYKFSEAVPDDKTFTGSLLKAGLSLGVGGLMVFFLSEPFVDSMIEIAHEFGISPVTIAVVLGPLASEMPEKLTAFITVMRDAKLAEISICNFIGSKVNHNSLLLGTLPIIAAFQGQAGVGGILSPSFVLMTLLTVIATLSLARRKLQRWEGFVFLLFYFVVIWEAFQRV